MTKIVVEVKIPGKGKNEMLSLSNLGIDVGEFEKIFPAIALAGVRVFSLFIIRVILQTWPLGSRRKRVSQVHGRSFSGEHEQFALERSWLSIASGSPNYQSSLNFYGASGAGWTGIASTSVPYMRALITGKRGISAKARPLPFLNKDGKPQFLPPGREITYPPVPIILFARQLFDASRVLSEIARLAVDFVIINKKAPTADYLYQQVRGKVGVMEGIM